MQIAAQHLQIPPPSPQMLRPDLPVTAEQVMLRSLAKRPSDRYMRAQDLANAFRMSLMGTGIQLGMSPTYSGSFSTVTGPRIPMPGELFDSGRQSAKSKCFSRYGREAMFLSGVIALRRLGWCQQPQMVLFLSTCWWWLALAHRKISPDRNRNAAGRRRKSGRWFLLPMHFLDPGMVSPLDNKDSDWHIARIRSAGQSQYREAHRSCQSRPGSSCWPARPLCHWSLAYVASDGDKQAKMRKKL